MPAFTPPPPAPQRGDRATFSQRVDAFLTWLVALIPQLNSFFASLTSLAAGGAASFAYSFDSTIDDNDPGPGSLRLSSANQSTSMFVRLDNLTDDGVDITSYLDAYGASTSTIKGSIRIQKVNDATRWILFDVLAVTSLGGYRNLSVQIRAASTPNPFTKSDPVLIYFDRKGDKGEGGNTPTPEEMRAAIGTLPIENGGTGATTATGARTNLGLGNVDNTSDANKPVSVPQQTALDGKLSLTGGVMSGNLDFMNDKGIFMRDGSGAPRQVARLQGQDLNFTVPGGTVINYYNQAGTMVVGQLTNSGVWSSVKNVATSDERLKKNWRAIPDDFLEQFAAIERAGLFDWSNSGETDGGIGAQSIQEIAPWCVEEVKGVLRVNHAALNTVVSHALTRRVLRNEAMQ